MDLQLANFASVIDLLKAFPDEQACINHLEMLRWEGVVVSPFDAESTVYKLKNNRYKCRNSNRYFNVRTGTIFEDTKLPLQKWFMALYTFTSHKKGISSHQLAKNITVTQKTAWFVLHRLRYAFDHEAYKQTMDGLIQLDETFVGGKEKNKHSDKKTPGTQGRSSKVKKPVLGILEVEEKKFVERPHKLDPNAVVMEKIVTKPGRIIAKVIPNTNQNTMIPIVRKYVRRGTTICTDEHRAYAATCSVYDHRSINHAARQYVDGFVSTNGLENFWSQFKRGIIGVYHNTSPWQLQAYADEFALRYNTRHLTTSERFNLVVQSAYGKRLTYKQLTSRYEQVIKSNT